MKPYERLQIIFDEESKNIIESFLVPFLRKNKAVIFWGNGTVCCEKKDGENLEESPELLEIERKIYDDFGSFINGDPLWSILATYTGVYANWGQYSVSIDFRK